MTRPWLSLIIPTYNRRDCLRRTLQATAMGDGVEVIVVDDASDDQTVSMLAAEFPQVVARRLSVRQGPSVARNVGLEVATGQHFLPLDSDCFLVPETLNWLRQNLAAGQHLVFPCRPLGSSWQVGGHGGDRPFGARDVLLRTCGEVTPVLDLDRWRALGLNYPALFAGGEPLILADLALLEPLHLVDRVAVQYRRDLPDRISSWRYQLRHPGQIAQVFEAVIPYLQGDPQLAALANQTRFKSAVYRALAGDKAPLRQWAARQSPAARPLALLSHLPTGVLRLLFQTFRRLQGSP